MAKIIKMIKKKIVSPKIRTKFLLLVFLTGIFCFFLFQLLWQNKWKVWMAAQQVEFLHLPKLDDDFYSNLYDAALNYSVPDSETNIKQQKAFEPFYDICDDYTGLYIYDIEDGYYRTGKFPDYFHTLNDHFYNFFIAFTADAAEEQAEVTLLFKNGYYSVMMHFYHAEQFLLFYYVISLSFCAFLFLLIIFYSISRKMQAVIHIEKEILRMSSGDLEHPIFVKGNDEISILGKELNHLRLTLLENIRQEQESRKANQDLITALSHDLRTPLTILRGYLEVIQLRRSPKMQEEYLKRCLKKTDDIRELTDRMFEYALVSEEEETPKLTWLPLHYIGQCLKEHCDYIQLAGFSLHYDFPENKALFAGDISMLKRVFTNLFSNILKYGEKSVPVTVSGKSEANQIHIFIQNAIKQEFSLTESNHIGMKNVEKIVKLLDGKLQIQATDNLFTVHLLFSLK